MKKKYLYYRLGRLHRKGTMTNRTLGLLKPLQGDTLRTTVDGKSTWQRFDAGEWVKLPMNPE